MYGDYTHLLPSGSEVFALDKMALLLDLGDGPLCAVLGFLDARSLSRACCVVMALRDAEREHAEIVWQKLLARQWPWAVTSRCSAKLRYMSMYEQVIARAEAVRLLNVEQIHARYQFFLECSDASTSNSTMELYPRIVYDESDVSVCFETLDTSGPLHVLGPNFELFARRRSDGAHASFVQMLRTRPDHDFETTAEMVKQGWVDHLIRVHAEHRCPWAFDTDVNPVVPDFPVHGAFACFSAMHCSFIVTFDDDNNQPDEERASVGATWPEIIMDIKFDSITWPATHLSLTQLNLILAQKLAWST